MLELLQAVGLGLVMVLPLANPLTTMILFLALAEGMSPAEQQRQITLTCLYVFLILLIAFYGGQFVLKTFGISIPGLRIAGGLIVMLIGLHMLFSPQNTGGGTREAFGNAAEMRAECSPRPISIAFVPLAMPSTAGPGTIALLISAAAQIERGIDITPWVITVAPTLVFLLVSLILWLCLSGSRHIMRRLGRDGIAAISRLMGFLLVCIGTQFIINGVLDIVTGLPTMEGVGA